MTDTTATMECRDFAAVVACGVFVGVMLCSVFVGSAAMGSVNAVATEQDNASFVTERIVKSSGSVVTVRIDLAGASAATVLIEGRESDYTANVTVYDTTDDGTATLSFDTSQSEQNSSSFSAGDDELRVQSVSSRDHPMAGTYALELQTDSTRDTATLTLQPTAIDSLTTQTAPGSMFSTLDTIANVSAIATDDQTIAIDDVMILQLSAPELSAALAKDASDTETGIQSEPERRLLELIQSGTVDIRIRQTNSENIPPKAFNLSATIENDGLELLSDEGGVYLLIDTNRAVFDRGETTVGTGTGDRFEVTVTGNNGLENETTVSESVRIVPRSASFETGIVNGPETVTVKSDANQTVAGETSVAPGTNLTIQAQSNGNSSFVITRTAQVRPNGTFAINFDFTNVTKGTRFVFMIPNQEFTDNASVSGVVRRSATASVSVNNQHIRSNGTQSVVIRSVDLSDGGFVAVYDRTFFDSNNETEPSDALRGVSQYRTPGKYTNVTIQLDDPYANSSTIVAVPYLDTNDNNEFDAAATADTSGDEPYSRADGGPVANSANVSMGGAVHGGNANGVSNEGVAPTSLDSTIDSSNAKNTTGSGAHPVDGTTGASGNDTKQSGGAGSDGGTRSGGEATGEQGPGFGLIVGLVAMGVLALLAVRQRHND